MQIRNHCYEKKKMQSAKYYCDNDFAETNCDVLNHEQSVGC